jgi:hypothetical protein
MLLQDAPQKTLDWHQDWKGGRGIREFNLGQIHFYKSSE